MEQQSQHNADALLVETNASQGGLQLVDPKAVTRHAPDDLVALAQEIQKADKFIHATASGKLAVIVEQMRHLQQLAHKVLQEAKTSTDLHHAACNFRKVPGRKYHLYRRVSGQIYFSMLSPEEWGAWRGPNEFLGTYRLEYDMSWTPEDKIDKRDSDMEVVNKFLACAQNEQLLSIASAP